MPSDDQVDALATGMFGMLTPATAGHGLASDAHIATALVHAEIGLLDAYANLGLVPWVALPLVRGLPSQLWRDAPALAVAAISSGNPVVPLVERMRAAVADLDPELVRWVHLGATSQDILDTALMLVARSCLASATEALREATDALADLAETHRDDLAAARTLGQHAVPTTVGARIATWLRPLVRARRALVAVSSTLPAQLGGAAGTQASFVQLFGPAIAADLPADYAEALQLAVPDAPWHTDRAPVLALAHEIGAAIAAMGVLATDVVTLTRPEVAEASIGRGGGSSAMPQKRNPVDAVLLRSAAMRAPALVGQLFLAAGLAGDERPDGAWHAEWPALQELLRILVGSAERTRDLCTSLAFDAPRARTNLDLTGGLLVSERLALTVKPIIGERRFAALMGRATAGEDLAGLLRAQPEDLDVADLLDPAQYLGSARRLVDDAVRDAREEDSL